MDCMKLILIILIAAVVLQYVELQRFRITTYCLTSNKLKEPCEILFLSDLHGKTFGDRLLLRLQKLSPDLILIGGDVVSKKHPHELDYMPDFLCKLRQIAPVYYGFGNHETSIDVRLSQEMPTYGQMWEEYLAKVKEAQIPILRNEQCSLRKDLELVSLELPREYFIKFEKPSLQEEEVKNLLPDLTSKDDRFRILLAHNPAYGDTYTCLDPDLILSGHTHGGLVRFPFVGSLISTELTFNPKYDGGRYTLKDQKGKESTMIVSKGLGTHTYHIRILDRAEAVRIILKPEK